MKNMFFYETAIGTISIVENRDNITGLYFVNDKCRQTEGIGPKETSLLGENIETGETPWLGENVETRETPLLREAKRQLDEYFSGKLKYFDLPLSVKGTDFQTSVWKVLQSIPYGQTWTYKEVAERVGSPKAARAVGMANNKNPISLIIPCHRVIGANAKLVGYGGGLHIKEYLLNMERENI